MHIKFQKNGVVREVKHGFSWTIFFFGWLALIVRKQYGLAAIGFFTFNLASLYFMFAGNRMLARQMAEDGWQAMEQTPSAWGIAV